MNRATFFHPSASFMAPTSRTERGAQAVSPLSPARFSNPLQNVLSAETDLPPASRGPATQLLKTEPILADRAQMAPSDKTRGAPVSSPGPPKRPCRSTRGKKSVVTSAQPRATRFKGFGEGQSTNQATPRGEEALGAEMPRRAHICTQS